jgi:PAS domain S-box-containing protein
LIATAVAGSLTLVGIRQVRTVHHALRLGDRLEVARAGLETSVRERTSELEATTASLRDSEVRLRHAQRVAAVGSWEIDLASGAVRWSDELFRLQRRAIDAGAPAFEELPRNYTTESWERLSAAVGHLSATGEPFELDLAVIRDDGTPWWQAARGEAVRAATGEIVGLRGAVVDITERKIAESVLRESEARYKSMFESAPIAVNITRGTDIIYANPGYLRSYGLTDMDDLRRREPLALFAPPSRAMVRENIERRAAGLPVPDSYEAMAQRTDGSTFPIIMYLARTTFAD